MDQGQSLNLLACVAAGVGIIWLWNTQSKYYMKKYGMSLLGGTFALAGIELLALMIHPLIGILLFIIGLGVLGYLNVKKTDVKDGIKATALQLLGAIGIIFVVCVIIASSFFGGSRDCD